MKIALVTISFPPDNVGAPFPASYELAKALKALGHKVLVLTLTQGETRMDTHEGMSVYRQKINHDDFPGLRFPMPLAFPNCVPQALELFRNSQSVVDEFCPDVIESQEFNGLGLFFGLDRKYPFVVRVYGPLTHLLRSGLIGKFTPIDTEIVHTMEIGSVGSADRVVALCTDIAQQMSSWSGVGLEKFTVLPTPITPTGRVYPHIEAEEGAPFPRILYWGRIERQKGADLLLEALPKIAQKYPNFKLTLSGKETTEGGASEPYAEVMRRRLKDLGLFNNVEFAGFLSAEELQQRVALTDICVFPSRYETACYAAIEAAMYGGCVLATKVGGLPDHICDRTSGLLVEPESPDALAEGVITLAGNPELRKKLREGAREDVIARCAPQTNAEKSLEVYRTAIESFDKRHQHKLIVRRIVEGVTAGLQTTHFEQQVYDLLCQKYSEGAKSGFEEGFKTGYEAGKVPERSILTRITGKVRQLAKR